MRNLSLRCSTIVAVLLAAGLFACQRPVQTDETTEAPVPDDPTNTEPANSGPPAAPEHAVGETSRSWIVDHHPNWAPEQGAKPDRARAKKLADVAPGARIDVYLGTWCPDSHREVTRFWRALDLVDGPPFAVHYVGLDRNFEAGEVNLQAANIVAVPTFVVTRDGQEVGRVVETSVDGIESDLGALLRGEASGTISASRGE